MYRFIRIQLDIILFVMAFAEELPNNVVPKEYTLKIITNLADEDDSFNFKGSVLIHVKCISPTDSITLHSKNLTIDDGEIILRNLNGTGENLTISGISRDLKNDFLILRLTQRLQADHHYEVGLHFQGDLGEEKVGYYRSSYSNEGGNAKWLGVTYFKPSNARRAFPCFDELTFKAKFTISLGRRKLKFMSLSNMPLLKTEAMDDKPGWEWDHFQTTPPMSTYSVGFLVADFKHEINEEDSFGVSIWGLNSDIIYGHPVLDYSITLLRTLRTKLGIGYPLPKLDIVIVPKYAVSIMDSWGLVFWQRDFLMQSAMSLVGFNPEFMDLVADQIVRQIFGNVVTIKSWRDLWFAEGFHMYLSQLLVDSSMVGRVQLFRSDITDDIISVFSSDSLEYTQAIQLVSNDSANVGMITDENARKKLFLLIRMLSHFVGQTNLLKALHKYLKIYEYSNAGSQELLDLINDEVSWENVEVKEVMRSWVSQAGFPLITVTRDYKRGTLEVTQERFFKNNKLFDRDSTKWWIPLTYTTECESAFGKTTVRKWLSPNDDSVSIKGPLSPGDWVMFNIEASGLYLVNYDEKNWHLLIDFLHKPMFHRIPHLNRVHLINNAANLAWIGRLDYAIFLDMLKYLIHEPYDHPKYAAVRWMEDLNALLKRTPVHDMFLNYVNDILQNDLEDVASKFTAKIMNKYPKFMKIQQRSTFSHIVDSVSLAEIILCIGDAEKEYSWSEYVLFKMVPDRKYEILRSLTCSQNQPLLQEFLERSLDKNSTGSGDLASVIAAVAVNKNAFYLLRQFLARNIETICDRLYPDLRELSPGLIEIARQTMTEKELYWFKKFIQTNRKYLTDIQNGVLEALEIAWLNVQWHKHHYRTIETYFNEI